jgi:hypothetical protein
MPPISFIFEKKEALSAWFKAWYWIQSLVCCSRCLRNSSGRNGKRKSCLFAVRLRFTSGHSLDSRSMNVQNWHWTQFTWPAALRLAIFVPYSPSCLLWNGVLRPTTDSNSDADDLRQRRRGRATSRTSAQPKSLPAHLPNLILVAHRTF